MPFRSVQHVYFDDLDALNILHNVRFLLFLERARGDLFNTLGFHWKDDVSVNPDKFHVVAEHTIKYLVPFEGEGDIAAMLTVTHIGTTSLRIAGRLESVDGSVLYAESATRLVRLDPKAKRPSPWSERFRSAMAAFER